MRTLLALSLFALTACTGPVPATWNNYHDRVATAQADAPDAQGAAPSKPAADKPAADKPASKPALSSVSAKPAAPAPARPAPDRKPPAPAPARPAR